jgi:hypothetical protein
LAVLPEVGSDAIVRKGLRGSGVVMVLIGCIVLGLNGIAVNTIKWDFPNFSVFMLLCSRW